jgi:hypothetical protein
VLPVLSVLLLLKISLTRAIRYSVLLAQKRIGVYLPKGNVGLAEALTDKRPRPATPGSNEDFLSYGTRSN